MDSVPRIQGAFAPLFLEEWGRSGCEACRLWRGLDGGSVYFGVYVHSFMYVCMYVGGRNVSMHASILIAQPAPPYTRPHHHLQIVIPRLTMHLHTHPRRR